MHVHWHVKTHKHLFTALLLAVVVASLAAPAALFAQSVLGEGFIPCGRDTTGPDGKPDGKVGEGEACTFNDILTVIRRIVNFIMILSASIAAIAFAYAGWLYMSAGGDTGQIGKAHQVFTKVAIGFFFVLAAWLIVWTITSMLIRDDTTFTLLKGVK